jgi:thiamine kinase-like enzyme
VKEQVMIEPSISLDHIGRLYKLINEVPDFQNSRISSIEILPGGLTNSNYKLTINGITYAVRLAGEGTMEYLNRPAEKHNAQLMADIGISAPIIYYDETSGNQVCKYIDYSKTLHIPDFKEDHYLSMAARVFRKYHDCNKEFISEFNPLLEIENYIQLLAEKNFEFYEGAALMQEKIEEIR